MRGPRYSLHGAIGLDFGPNDITFSHGLVLIIDNFDDSRIRQLQSEISKLKKGSDEYKTLHEQLLEEYRTKRRQNRSIRGRVLQLLKAYAGVFVQKDCIQNWIEKSKNFDYKPVGDAVRKAIYGSAIGSILALLAPTDEEPKTIVNVIGVLGRYEATTRTCYRCGFKNNIGKEQVYRCKKCKLVIHRDLNAARNILIEGMKREQLPSKILKPRLYLRQSDLHVVSKIFQDTKRVRVKIITPVPKEILEFIHNSEFPFECDF